MKLEFFKEMTFQDRMLTPFNPISRLGKIKTNLYEIVTIFKFNFISKWIRLVGLVG